MTTPVSAPSVQVDCVTGATNPVQPLAGSVAECVAQTTVLECDVQSVVTECEVQGVVLVCEVQATVLE